MGIEITHGNRSEPKANIRLTSEELEAASSSFTFTDEDMIAKEIVSNLMRFFEKTQIGEYQGSRIFYVRGLQSQERGIGLATHARITENLDSETKEKYPLHYEIQIKRIDRNGGTVKTIHSSYQAPSSAEELVTEIKRGAIGLLAYDAAEARRTEAEALASK